MKTLICILSIFSLSLSTMASTQNLKSTSLIELTQKYEYLLTSHPNAHVESFRKEQMSNFKDELQAFFEGKDIDQLKEDALDIIAKVPEDDKRIQFEQVVKNGSRKEILELFANEKLLKQAFRGEGSNFTGELTLYDYILYLTAAIILYAIADAISERINYETFHSYSIEGWYDDDFNSCSISHIADSTIQAMKNDAYNKCVIGATYPETCRFHEWKTSTSVESRYDYYGSTYTTCSKRVYFKADRRQ